MTPKDYAIQVIREEAQAVLDLIPRLDANFDRAVELIYEEEDMLWSETQLDLIGKIGLQNWLVKQL